MTQRAPAQSATISEGVAIVVSPENAPCALMRERATTHPLERPPLWPVLSCRRLAGFEVSTEARLGAARVARLIPTARIVALPPSVGHGGDVTDFFVRLSKSQNDFLKLLDESAPLLAAEKHPTLPSPSISRPGSPAHSDIHRLKAAVRIEEIIGQYLPLHRSGRALKGRCCFHEDHVPSLAVFPDTQSFYCFGCQKHGDVIMFLMAAEHIAFPEAVRVLQLFAHHK